MPAITLADAQANLSAAQAAYRAALEYKSQTVGDRTKQLHDISALRAEITHWQRQVDHLTALDQTTGAPRVRGLILQSI